MLTILGKRSSINVRKVLWTCEEIGLAYQQEDYGSGFKPLDTPEFQRLNPNSLVPVLLDDDFVLWGVEQHLPLSGAESGALGSAAR
ncbi:putative glutathione S-transferase [Klebsiella quasipneumoniae]|nr:putative glutathione S-transferase [Klebsiella quasipneumoniae]